MNLKATCRNISTPLKTVAVLLVGSWFYAQPTTGQSLPQYFTPCDKSGNIILHPNNSSYGTSLEYGYANVECDSNYDPTVLSDAQLIGTPVDGFFGLPPYYQPEYWSEYDEVPNDSSGLVASATAYNNVISGGGTFYYSFPVGTPPAPKSVNGVSTTSSGGETSVYFKWTGPLSPPGTQLFIFTDFSQVNFDALEGPSVFPENCFAIDTWETSYGDKAGQNFEPGDSPAAYGGTGGPNYHIVQCSPDQNGIYEIDVDVKSDATTDNEAVGGPGTTVGPIALLSYAGLLLSYGEPVPVGPLSAQVIDKDNPANTTYAGLGSPAIVYGGSIPSTSDSLVLSAADSSPVSGATYTWTVTGMGSGSFNAPGESTPTWNVGAIGPTAGNPLFQCLVQYPNGTAIFKQITIEIGIRSDDAIAIGWIDPIGVTISSAGVSAQILHDLAPGLGNTGMPGTDPNYPFNPVAATARLAALSANDDHLGFLPTNPNDILSATDRNYILDWMFKYAANPDPAAVLTTMPGFSTSADFMGTAGYIDYAKLAAYIAVGTNYKLINHLQVKYRVNLSNTSQFNGMPVLLNGSQGLVGATINPTGIPFQIPAGIALLDFFDAIQALQGYIALFTYDTLEYYVVHTQNGPMNNLFSMVGTHVSLINDGSPDLPAVRAFNTTVALHNGIPIYWENIGSKWNITCGSTTPVLSWQPYPTYNTYINGPFQTQKYQAAIPQNEFVSDPYPFGDDDSIGLPPTIPGLYDPLAMPTIPGGRDGIAWLPASNSARIPPSGFATP